MPLRTTVTLSTLVLLAACQPIQPKLLRDDALGYWYTNPVGPGVARMLQEASDRRERYRSNPAPADDVPVPSLLSGTMSTWRSRMEYQQDARPVSVSETKNGIAVADEPAKK